MANLFEKPIAANPMSEFVALPMDFIDRSMQRKQSQYDRAKAELEDQENSLLKLSYLPGDADRHHEIQQGFEDQLNTIVEGAGGDYSTIRASLDSFSRKLRTELAHGELGAQQNAFMSAMKFKEAQDKRNMAGRSSTEGHALSLASINKHVTSLTDSGQFTTFQGYDASSTVNPLKKAQDSVDEIVAKFDSEGMKNVSSELIKQNLANLFQTDSSMLKSLQEKAAGKKNLDGTPMPFGKFLDSFITGVIADKQFQEVSKSTSSSGDGRTPAPMTMLDVGQPAMANGALTYTGGSNTYGKDIAAAVLGTNSYKTHNEWVDSKKGKDRIAFMEAKSGTKMPSDPHGQADWILKNSSGAQIGKVITRGANATERGQVNSRGQLINPNAAIRSRTGKLLSGDEVQAMQGTSVNDGQGTPRITQATHVVTAGGTHPPGTTVILSHDGNQYFQEPSDTKLLRSSEYNESLIQMAAETNTGSINITTSGTIGGIIPPGNYEVENTFGTQEFKIFQNGKLVFLKFGTEIRPVK